MNNTVFSLDQNTPCPSKSEWNYRIWLFSVWDKSSLEIRAVLGVFLGSTAFSSLLVFTSKQHEITQICIAYNRQTARGAMGCDTLNTKNTFFFNRYSIFFFLASTPRILAVKWNVLDEHATWVMATVWKWLQEKAIKGYLGTYLLFRPFCCDKNIAHLEINANKLLISCVCLVLLKWEVNNAATWLVE